jgi:predicted enzyme related to lactoylglutathione lyase
MENHSYRRRFDKETTSPTTKPNYISVSSIDEYSSKVKELGGKVVLPKTEITGYDFFAVCIDKA